MPNTPKGLTYPSSSSPVAVPADIQELATDVDGLIVPNTGGTYTGSVSFTQSPSVPTPTSGLHAVNKTYADAINADVTALETELGTNPSGAFSTVADRLNTQDHPASTTDNTVARYDGTQGKLQTSTVVIDDNGRLTTVTGASGGYGFVGGAIHLTGTGSPESVISAAPGSTYLQTDSVVDVKGWIRWNKATGTGNTGWIAGPESDTGWRNVTASLDSTFKTNNANATVLLRRVGDRVEWILNETVAGSTSGTATLWTTVPSGFRPLSSPGLAAVACLNPNSGLPISESLYINVSTMYGFGWTAVRHYALLAYSTADAWPTSLPGSAA